MKRIALVLIALALAPTVLAEPSLLLVRIVDSEFTEYSACSDDDCIPYSLWTIHDAEVKKVIAGDYSNKKIRFVRLQHGQYIDRIREHLFVLVDETDDEKFVELFGTNLVADETAHPVSLICFGTDLVETFPKIERFEHDRGQFKSETCFDQDVIENGLQDD